MPTDSVAAIVVAGGSSRRMGFDKLWADLHGRPVFLHSLATLQASPDISHIVLVTPASASASNREAFQKATRPLDKVRDVISGGTERHLSVWAGLQTLHSLAPAWVAVHDAARPLLSARDLAAVISAARIHGAAALAQPVADTLKRADADQFVHESLSREHLWAMQTPQVFSYPRLVAAYQRLLAAGELVTDEVSAVAKTGDRVKLVPVQDYNFKVTFSCDIELARLALTSPLQPKN